MKGVTTKGTFQKVRRPGMVKVSTVPSASNFRGQTQPVSSKKSSKTAGFGASKRCGSMKGNTGR